MLQDTAEQKSEGEKTSMNALDKSPVKLCWETHQMGFHSHFPCCAAFARPGLRLVVLGGGGLTEEWGPGFLLPAP